MCCKNLHKSEHKQFKLTFFNGQLHSQKQRVMRDLSATHMGTHTCTTDGKTARWPLMGTGKYLGGFAVLSWTFGKWQG